ncbi:transglycosylase SLT domain-containing protein [Catellatospora sichuanensis]|uniref:transglycosylase SLT domain-containing protein n=1 Tax=Catellatospora sichuanensis TaxID=1969805 RepID=UPI0011845289|nr:transglycosylase SLT domain-containing protein [Catellatospora sichuanensis]
MRFTRTHAVVGTFTVVAAVLAAAVLVLDRGGDPDTGAEPRPSAVFETGELPEPSESAEASPSASPSPSVKPSPSKSLKPKPKPKPSPKKVDLPGPPPPAPKPSPSAGVKCPTYKGTNAPKAEVETALEAAAARRFWTVSQISLPPKLIKAVAKQESGWQSAIIACDGGIGTMQVMPSTATWLNDDSPFTLDEDVNTLNGNTMLGSAYLQWLVRYFGMKYGIGCEEPDPAVSPAPACTPDYTLREEDCRRDPNVADSKEWCLLNAVISAYNYGQNAVDKEINDGDEVWYPNAPYVLNVRALMEDY